MSDAPVTVLEFEPTPNPEAVRCTLSARVCADRVSARSEADAAAHPLAAALFDAGARNVLIVEDWMSVTRAEGVSWPTMKRRIRRAVERTAVAESDGG